MNLGVMLHPYTLPNRYDALRMLDGRIFNYRKELLEAFERHECNSSNVLIDFTKAMTPCDAEFYAENLSLCQHKPLHRLAQC